jgi:hypothetical protein
MVVKEIIVARFKEMFIYIKMTCDCYICMNTNKSILERINHPCDCETCVRFNSYPFLYLTCVEIHFCQLYQYDIKKAREHIEQIKKDYKRKKRLVVLYIYCRHKFLELYTETTYRPEGEKYKEIRDRFYARLR